MSKNPTKRFVNLKLLTKNSYNIWNMRKNILPSAVRKQLTQFVFDCLREVLLLSGFVLVKYCSIAKKLFQLKCVIRYPGFGSQTFVSIGITFNFIFSFPDRNGLFRNVLSHCSNQGASYESKLVKKEKEIKEKWRKKEIKFQSLRKNAAFCLNAPQRKVDLKSKKLFIIKNILYSTTFS